MPFRDLLDPKDLPDPLDRVAQEEQQDVRVLRERQVFLGLKEVLVPLGLQDFKAQLVSPVLQAQQEQPEIPVYLALKDQLDLKDPLDPLDQQVVTEHPDLKDLQDHKDHKDLLDH